MPHGSLKKANVDLKSRWPFVLQEYPLHVETSQLALFEYGLFQPQKKNQVCSSAPRSHQSHFEASQPA